MCSEEVGGVIGCQLRNIPISCVGSSLLQEEFSFLCLARERLLQQMTKTVLVCQILGALKKGNLSNRLFHLDRSWPYLTQVWPLHLAVFFIDTGDPE